MNRENSDVRRLGRPRNEKLRGAILRAARRLFLTHGAAVSLEAIAREADTSKVTLYSHFASKEELLNAMLIEQVTSPFNFAVEQLDPLKPRIALLILARKYLELVLGCEVIENMMVLIAAPKLDLAIPASFFESGPYALTKALARYLSRVPELRIQDPESAAEQFLAMVRGNEQMRLMLSLPPRRTSAKRRAYLEGCVDVFVRGYAKDASGRT